MATYIKEDNAKFLDRMVKIPDEQVNKIISLSKSLGDNYKNKEGRKRLEKIANGGEKNTKEYNKRSDKKELAPDDGVYISTAEVKRAVHDLKDKNNPNDLTVILNGGLEMKNFYKNKLNQLRTANKPTEIVKQVKQNTVNIPKVSANPTKPVTVNGGAYQMENTSHKKIYIGENQLNALR